MSITTALEARRDALREREAGFTLIELLVVVIIIGILAAIAIPVYLGVQNNAKDSSVKSDLTNAKTAIVTVGTDYNGSLPTAITAGTATVTGGSATVPSGSTTATVNLVPNGWSKGTNTVGLTYAYNSTVGTWCVLGESSTGNKFQITSSGEVVSVAKTLTACTPA